MSQTKDIFSYITEQENSYDKPYEVISGWQWNLKEHIRKAILYLNSQFAEENEKKKSNEHRVPFKNIVRQIVNLQFRTEGFNVKDVGIYVDDEENHHKSYLVRRFHERWARENGIDTFIDELVESFVVFGGALAKNIKGVRPEVVDLTTLAFCNQKDILSRPFGIKHFYSPDELLEMAEAGWGEESNGATISLEDLIILTENQAKDGDIEIYEIHGVMPEKWIDSKKQESKKYVRQEHIVAYYKNSSDEEVGVTLFKSRSPKQMFKFLKRDEIPNRAVGLGGVEELEDPQIWTNFAQVTKMKFLEAASKIVMQTTDPTLVAKHPTGLKGIDNLEIVQKAPNTEFSQVDTFPRNYQVFANSVNEWEEHAKSIASASDPLLGEEPKSGTPFRLAERVVMEGKGLHEYRKEKIARFVEEIYREWIMPYIGRKLVQGVKFLSEIPADKLEQIANNVAIQRANQEFVNQVLEGKLPSREELALLKEQTKIDFLRKGNERFMEILKDELKDVAMEVKIDIAGKQRDLGLLVDKLSNIFRQIFANPAILQDPNAVRLLNNIFEYSGFSAIDFNLSQPTQMAQGIQPLTELAQQSTMVA